MSERIWGALRKNALYKSTYTLLLYFTCARAWRNGRCELWRRSDVTPAWWRAELTWCARLALDVNRRPQLTHGCTARSSSTSSPCVDSRWLRRSSTSAPTNGHRRHVTCTAWPVPRPLDVWRAATTCGDSWSTTGGGRLLTDPWSLRFCSRQHYFTRL